jgi:hypothetical protein
MARRDSRDRDDRRREAAYSVVQPARVSAQPKMPEIRITNSMTKPNPKLSTGSAYRVKRSDAILRSVVLKEPQPVNLPQRALPLSIIARAEKAIDQRRETRRANVDIPDDAPSAKLTPMDQEKLAQKGVTLRDDDKACLSENRPKNNKGDGTSRPFVPWCQKGKK